MQAKRRWLLITVLMLALCPLLAAADITYTISGTLGPILSGSDPLGANGENGTLTATFSPTLTATSHTSTSATYTLPAGAILVDIGGTIYETVGTSTMKYNIPSSGPDTIVITSKVNVDGIDGTVVGTASLAHGSFKSAALKHPTTFTPASQTLTAATKAGGAGSQVQYSVPLLGTTVLGLSGTATSAE
jgi:hypothetical protein